MDFVYCANPSRVIFAVGARSKTGEELDRLGVSRIMVVTTPPQAHIAAEFARLIGRRAGIVYPGAQMHTPTNVTEAALTAVSSVKADGVLAIGGGTAIGMSKAIALRTDLPQLVLPTTFAGSEMTPTLIETERGVRTTQRSLKVLPETVIYDPELVSALPPSIAGPSVMNAMAHSVEALYARDANPATSLMAEESIRALGDALPRILANAMDKDAWTEAQYGAWLAGVCLGSVGMAVHHKICQTLADAFDVKHADVHCVMLPYTVAFNSMTAPEATRRLARALGCNEAASALYALMLKAGGQTTLKEMGLTRAALERAADIASKDPRDNSKPITREDILEMLLAAYEGEPLIGACGARDVTAP
jgi:maleylacetate reductase